MLWLFQHAVGRVIVVSALTVVVTAFLRMYSHPAKSPFRWSSYANEDLALGVEFALAALVSYFAAVANEMVQTHSNSLPAHYFDAAPTLVLIVLMIPMYLRAEGWVKPPRQGYKMTRHGVVVTNMLGFAALIDSMHLIGGLPS